MKGRYAFSSLAFSSALLQRSESGGGGCSAPGYPGRLGQDAGATSGRLCAPGPFGRQASSFLDLDFAEFTFQTLR
jgi:hypothetical protein